MLVLVNYRVGNFGSILNMLKKIGIEAIISTNISDIEKADRLILPGVGAFDNGMRNLNDSGLVPALHEKIIDNKTPILGICLGMQLLTKRSEEGSLPGLGWIDAQTVKFKFNDNHKNLKIPHMGWNTAKVVKQSALFNDINKEQRFYFVHSYHVVCNDAGDILTKTMHGCEFASAIQRDNILGVQFHPEKSHKFGMKLLKNFAERF